MVLPSFGQRHTCLSVGFVGPHITCGRSLSSRGDSAVYARLVNPGFLGEPVVTGLADRAVRAREEHRTASEAFAIRFDAGRDRASRLRAFDHEYTHLQPPCFSFPAGR
jgi:hypothetical protein